MMNLNIDTIALKKNIANFIIPLVSLVITAVLFLVVIRPALKEIPLIESEIKTNEITLSKLENKKRKLSVLRDFESGLSESNELLSRLMSEEPKVPELLTQIDLISKEAGVVLEKASYSFDSSGVGGSTDKEVPVISAVPEDGSQQPDSLNSADVVGQSGSDNQTLETIGGLEENAPTTNVEPKLVAVSINVKGTLNQIIEFMRLLENSARVISVTNVRYSLNISTTDEDTNIFSIQEPEISASFILFSPYVKIEEVADTDSPIYFSLQDSKFQMFLEEIKKLKYYEIDVSNLSDFSEILVDEEEFKEEFNEPQETPSSNPTSGDVIFGR